MKLIKIGADSVLLAVVLMIAGLFFSTAWADILNFINNSSQTLTFTTQPSKGGSNKCYNYNSSNIAFTVPPGGQFAFYDSSRSECVDDNGGIWLQFGVSINHSPIGITHYNMYSADNGPCKKSDEGNTGVSILSPFCHSRIDYSPFAGVTPNVTGTAVFNHNNDDGTANATYTFRDPQ